MKASFVIACGVLALAATQNAEAALPKFTYNLTAKPIGDRIGICNLNKGFCDTNCGGPSKAPKNFCNETTMGWGCGCSNKLPDLNGWLWPVNQQHCVGTGEACKAACNNDQTCLSDCILTYSSKCGTENQPPAYYNVEDVNQVPTYGPPSASNSSSNSSNPSGSNGTTTGGGSSASSSIRLDYTLGTFLSTLAIVAGGMMII